MQQKRFTYYPDSKDLHDIDLEKESCGTGFVAHLKQKESVSITRDAITMLIAMDHRSGRNADPETGDGVGITFSMPHTFFAKELSAEGVELPARGDYGMGNFFFPQDKDERESCMRQFEEICENEGLRVLHWRKLRTHGAEIGVEAQACEPCIVQVFVIDLENKHALPHSPKTKQESQTSELEKKLYFARKQTTGTYNQRDEKEERAYICSLSSRVVVYKGMLTASQLAKYYDDLQQDNFETYLGMMHSRFSTNTFPSWDRAQPFRMMSHNGEINTVFGNIAKMSAREGIMSSEFFGDKLKTLYPVVEANVSDSGAFDNTLEFLYHNGYSFEQALCMMIPEAWQHDDNISAEKKAMYQAYSCVMDPWDGPECITFTDGRYVGVVIDRNGLRPSRYYVTKDDRVIMASEFGVLEVDQKKVIQKDRLQPGKVFLLDTKEGRIIDDEEIKHNLSHQKPYEDWIEQQILHMDRLTPHEDLLESTSDELLIRKSISYGYTEEDKFFVIKPMIEQGKEPLGSMGNDVALACLSDKPRVLYDYFKQWFAQVTNPPIDSIRERNIMSVGAFIGPEGNLLHLESKHTHRLWVENPVLSRDEFLKIKHIDEKGWRSRTIDICYDVDESAGATETGDATGLLKALDRIKHDVLQATRDGIEIIILSDRKMTSTRIAVSSLMALGTVQNYLVEEHARSKAAIVLETGEPREIHHYCMLIGYGADAIFPYLVWDYAEQLLENKLLAEEISSMEKVESSYRKAVDYGICKVFAKMGISTIDSYKAAQIFEAVGLGKEVVNVCFKGTTSRIGGLGFAELAHEAKLLHDKGFKIDISIPEYGENIINLGNFQWRKDGHTHMWDPESIALLQHAVRYNKQDVFDAFVARQNQRSQDQATIRGLLKFKGVQAKSAEETPNSDLHIPKNSLVLSPIPLDEVDSVETILERFVSGAMSYGSISLEAHETLAIAMNRIGGKSNSGEGGEISERYVPLANGDSKRSAIKQVASGRFGVTIEYLANADEIQIKMAQGAKPGEGGELPGKKVFGLIAKTRHATPGIDLVSPPPHHDIYSIEDLAQLIYDLKNANPRARISVKLVSKSGVGIIAAGVTKAKADHILISGHDGGTGASPLTSIKHAGLPWEIGIAETHQVLVRSNLRSRVVLQTDGQLKTGRDVCIAAMLGAEEFGFATSTLIAMGCIMMRKCEINTCPVGIATQDEGLRKKFAGSPEHVIRFMKFLAEDVRKVLASLGMKSIEQIVGRSDLLEPDESVRNWKTKTIDLAALLGKDFYKDDAQMMHQCCSISQNHGLEAVLDVQIKKDCMDAVRASRKIHHAYSIKNTDRTTATMLSHEIAKLYGLKGLPEDTVSLDFKGHAGQSFGAFLSHGVTLKVEGDGNDYTGKGLSGGVLVFMPPKESGFVAEDNIIIGSVVLYGAITGKAFFRGRAAERFCIRNSGAKVVVEGVGAHGCEYMTGGCVVVLGTVYSNFGSGMSGGLAYIWDKKGSVDEHLNTNMVQKMALDSHDKADLKALVEEHAMRSESTRARYICDNWEKEVSSFVKVISPEYQRILNIQRTGVHSEAING